MGTLLRTVVWILAFFPFVDFLIRIEGDLLYLPETVKKGWDEVFLIACLILVIVMVTRSSRIPSISTFVLIPVLALIVWGLVSIFANSVPLTIGVDAFRVAYQPMLYAPIVLIFLRDDGLRAEFLDLTIACATLVAVLAILQYGLGNEGPRWINVTSVSQFRVASVFANPNALGGYLAMVLAFSLSLCLFGKEKADRMVFAASSGVILTALLFTYSRSAWIAAFTMCVLLAATKGRRAVCMLLAFAILAIFLAPAEFVDRFSELFDPDYYKQSAVYGRIRWWQDSLALLQEQPLIGGGMGAIGGSVSIRHGVPVSMWIDNHYLKIGAETGLIGLGSYLFLLGALFIQAIKAHHQSGSSYDKSLALGVAGTVVVMVIQNITASIWEALYVGVAFYSFVGVLLALSERPLTASETRE